MNIHRTTRQSMGTVIELSGRYPEAGWVLNCVSAEVCYVVKGMGTITVGDRKEEVKVDDIILILPEERYYWDGNLTLFIAAAPAWRPDQYLSIKES